MTRIAVVGLGGAGTNILEKLIEYCKLDSVDFYNVNEKRRLDKAKFYNFVDLDKAIDELSKYDHVILIAGLGSTGADSLVYIARRLKGAIAVVCMPFKIEKVRYMKAGLQLEMLNCKVILKDLNEMLETMPDAPIDLAFKTFDSEIASEVLGMIRALAK